MGWALLHIDKEGNRTVSLGVVQVTRLFLSDCLANVGQPPGGQIAQAQRANGGTIFLGPHHRVLAQAGGERAGSGSDSNQGNGLPPVDRVGQSP